jgi:hypothetical protein
MVVAVARALEADYLVEPTSEAMDRVASLPRHPRWHAPLMIDCGGNALELNQRIEVAGELWLGGFGCFSSNNLLIVTNRISGASYIFQRVQGPRGKALAMGPVDAALITEGKTIGSNPVFYAEREESLRPEEIGGTIENDDDEMKGKS